MPSLQAVAPGITASSNAGQLTCYCCRICADLEIILVCSYYTFNQSRHPICFGLVSTQPIQALPRIPIVFKRFLIKMYDF